MSDMDISRTALELETSASASERLARSGA